MISRPAPLALAATLLVAVLAGCSPAPAPSPAPTSGFASEEEAFAAAEETYRAYVDALNRVDLSDPETFEDVYAWTTGEANEGARETFSKMHADGLAVDGVTKVAMIEFSPTQSDSVESVDLDVCLDVSNVTLVDESGNSVVAPDRRDVQSMRVTMAWDATSPTTALISRISGRADGFECGA